MQSWSKTQAMINKGGVQEETKPFQNVVFLDSVLLSWAASLQILQFSWSIIISLPLLSLSVSGLQSQHFNYTWMRHIRQQDLCVAPQGSGNGFALRLCDNVKPELRWFHKSSNLALVGRLRVCLLLCLLSLFFSPFTAFVILEIL